MGFFSSSTSNVLQLFFLPTISWLAEILIVCFSFVVFAFLDCADSVLCSVFWVLDSLLDSEITPCYCKHRRNGTLPSTSQAAQGSRSVDADRHGDHSSHVELAHCSYGCSSHVQHARHGHESKDCPSQVEYAHHVDVNGSSITFEDNHFAMASTNQPPLHLNIVQRSTRENGMALKKFVPSSQDNDKNPGQKMRSRWSDCGCSTCTLWQSDEEELLYVRVEGKGDGVVPESLFCEADQYITKSSGIAYPGHENVVFIHGFLSSSSLWSEKVIPHLPDTTRESFRLYAVDLLGFGKSPKPRNCFYTMTDHIKKIEESVLHRYNIESFHLVAHSMGCIVALALAAAHVDAIKTITLVAPPYFPAPPNQLAASYVLRQLAPRRIWPLTAFGASVMSWYEHVGRGICFLLCKQHIVWEHVLKALTMNRVSSFAVRDFMQHTHHSAWHIFHNVICGKAHAMDGYLEVLERSGCEIYILHGKDDTLVPVHCSLQLQKRCHKSKLEVLDGANHFTIIYGCERTFSLTLDKIWKGTYSNKISNKVV